MPIFSGGGGGGSFNGGAITGPLTINATDGHALRVADATGGAGHTFLNVDSSNGGINFIASPLNGHSGWNLSTTAFTYTDELGNVQIDVEGGFTSLGPAGEVAVGGGQLAFYGGAAVAQPAHPTTLADVIAALVALGLVHA